jgi:hypothetical protein
MSLRAVMFQKRFDTGRRWFGSGERSFAILPQWLHALRMTSTAHFYTSEGFAITLDGRQSWGNHFLVDEHLHKFDSDDVQKIFEIT